VARLPTSEPSDAHQGLQANQLINPYNSKSAPAGQLTPAGSSPRQPQACLPSTLTSLGAAYPNFGNRTGRHK